MTARSRAPAPPPAPRRRPARWLALAALAALATSGCQRRSDAGPVVVSVVGKPPALGDPARGAIDMPSRMLLDSLAQGLVRFDATGQVTPGLAERWTVLDNGLSYVFRLRDATWSDGSRVTADDVVTILKRQIAPQSRNPLAPFLTAIDDIVEMTPNVIEVRLKRPRPDLLRLFAQPELAILRLRGVAGTGPFRPARRGKGWVLLRPAFDPVRAATDDVEEPGPAESVELHGERASRAIVRFQSREADLVTGGSFLDWPLIASVTDIAPANLRTEIAGGLFGLVVTRRDGFMATPENRIAIAQSIDRAALVAAFAPGWTADEHLLPEQLDSAAPPALPGWAALSPADRRAGARARVARWRADHPGPVVIRIGLPKGPGANILFGFVGASLRSIGIEPQRVPIGAPADLRLVDAIAPYGSARWYLGIACQLCSAEARASIIAARDAPDLATRARRLAEADAAMAQDCAYIPIARPLRWSLVAVRLRAWTGNPLAWHPLNDLRNERR